MGKQSQCIGEMAANEPGEENFTCLGNQAAFPH
jgi:hypothetical protein